MQVTNLKFYIHIKNIAVEGTVSRIFDIGPSFFSRKSRKKYVKDKKKVSRFFEIKYKLRFKKKI